MNFARNVNSIRNVDALTRKCLVVPKVIIGSSRNWGLAVNRLDPEIEEIQLHNVPAMAASMEPFPDLTLPVTLVGIDVPCVLQLRELLDKRTFRATLYMSDTTGEIQPPIGLVCTGKWREGDQLHVIEKVIGSIVAKI